jgi:hypothetical protein
MKCKNLIVLVQTKDNEVFQVGLTKNVSPILIGFSKSN